MKKKSVFLILPMILALVLIWSIFIKKVFVAEEKLPIVEIVRPDFEASWVFKASVCGEERVFEVYPWILNALVKSQAVSINLAECDEQCNEIDRMPATYIGQTEEGIHVLLTHGRNHHLLFVEILSSQGVTLRNPHDDKKFIFYPDQVLIKKIGAIPLGIFYVSEKDIKLNKNTLSIQDRVFTLDLTPPSSTQLMRGRFPYRFDSHPYVNPYLLWGLESNIRNGFSSTVAYNLAQAQNDPANAYLGVGNTTKIGSAYDYIYEGISKNGVHIVLTSYFQAHPATCLHLMLVFEKDYEISVDWDAKKIKRDKKRTLLKKVGELDLYLATPFTLKGNTISYTNMHWENKPFVITGPVEHEEVISEIEINTR